MPAPWASHDELSKAPHPIGRPNFLRRRRQQLLTTRKLSPKPESQRYPLSPLTSIQALTAMVRELRNGNGENGLILANGGVLTYQHVVCLSTKSRRDGSAYPHKNPLPRHVTDLPVPPICAQAEGEATVEVS